MGYRTELFINNEFAPSKDKSTFPLYNPTTEDHFCDVSEATAGDVDYAVQVASRAFKQWSDMPVILKAGLFAKLSSLITRDKDIFWELDRICMGRTYGMAQWEIMGAGGLFGMYANAGFYAQGKTSLNSPGMISFTLKQPYGVVAAIIPWNVSMIMFAMKVAPALAAGNCIIIKPSEKSPLSSLKLAELFVEAGFPPGVLSVLPGNGAVTGKFLAEHPQIRKIAFTGSIPTGKKIMSMAALSNLKNVTLELGGKSPAIIFADADLDKAVEAVEFSIHHNSGQHCCANSRVFVHSSVKNKFISKLRILMASRKLGDPSERDTFQGPQVDATQRDKIVGYLDIGKKDGELILGGNATSVNGKGCFIEPTIFADVPQSSAIYREEVFGPVVIVNTFENDEDVLSRANDSEYGLYSSLFTQNVERALIFAKGLEAGTVALNCSAPTQGLDMPVGGWKQSGIGREMFTYSLENFLQTKTVYFKYANDPMMSH